MNSDTISEETGQHVNSDLLRSEAVPVAETFDSVSCLICALTLFPGLSLTVPPHVSTHTRSPLLLEYQQRRNVPLWVIKFCEMFSYMDNNSLLLL